MREALVGDITYLPLTEGRWCYLAMFQDKLTRRIVGWAVEERMTARNAIVHTDRGSQYASRDAAANPGIGSTSTSSGETKIISIGWSGTAKEYRGRNGERFSFWCSPRGTAARLWGNDIYTDDSSICTAALHADALNYTSGGQVTIEILAGRSSYTGSTRNGITSPGYGSGGGSFVFVR